MHRRICVFCGSASGSRPAYVEAAISAAQCLVANDVGIVFGGGHRGLMGALADAALQAGGEVIGVMPRHLVDLEVAHTGVTDLRVAGSMHERKALMAKLSDAFLALPGGFGTIEEFCEVLTWTQLSLQRKPCGILNVEGYYNDLLTFFDHAVAEQFLSPKHRRIVLSGDEPAELIRRLLQYDAPVPDKYLNAQQT